MSVMKLCVHCQNPAQLMCSRCWSVYCGAQCQIVDWEEHKKTCITVPKLVRNNAYVNVLASGVTLPLQPSVEQAGTRMLLNSSRALKPLRKPHMANDGSVAPPIPMGTIEGSLNRASTAKLSEAPPAVSDAGQGSPKENRPEVAKPPQVASAEPVEMVQSLARLKLDIIKNHHQNAAVAKAKSDPPKAAPELKVAPQPKRWLSHFPIEKATGEPFEVIVQCLVKPNRVWVMMVSYEADCDKFLHDINQQLGTTGEPVKYGEIQVNDIFAAPYDNYFYRVVVLAKSDPSKSLLKVRLIDYGNEVTIPSTELRAPLCLMKNLPAFAFEVEIINLSHPLEVSERIRIRLTGAPERDGRKMCEIVQPPVTPYVLDMLGTGEDKVGEGGIVAILSSRTALVMLNAPAVKPTMKVLFNQMPEVAPKQFAALAAKPKNGDLICIDVADVGWSRAVVLDQHADNFIVYTVDNGTVELISDEKQILSLSDEYKQKPHLVLQMDLIKVQNEMEFKQCCYMPTFAFGFERISYDAKSRTMKATLKDAEGKRQLAEVTFRNFVCDLQQLDINYWPHIPQDKSVVRITSVLNATTVIVCPKERINCYTELLQTIMPGLKALTAAPKGNEVIVGLDEIQMPYRARVLKNVSPAEVEILDLDNGTIKTVPFGKLHAANGFIQNLPVFPMKVQIRDLDAATIKNPDVIVEQLQDLKMGKRTLKQLFEGKSYMFGGVKLIDLNTNRSLGSLLMEHHDQKIREAEEAARAEKLKREQQEEAARVAQAEAERQKREQEAEIERKRRAEEVAAAAAAAAATPSKLTFNDLKMVPLPVGSANVKLTILDDGELSQAAITVCEYNDENVQRYAKLNDDVNKIAKAIGGDGYDPESEELCVAIFDADKMWYRAVCLRVDKGSYVVQFVDYGNMAVVKRESVRKMPAELNFPCAAHLCTVKDISKALPKLQEQTQKLGYIVAVEVAQDGELYSLKF